MGDRHALSRKLPHPGSDLTHCRWPAAGAPPGYAGEIEAIAQTAAVTTTDWVPVSGGTFETAAQAVNRATARSAAGQAPPGTDNDPF